MYVDKIRVSDFRCFDHAEVSFVHPKSTLAASPFKTFNNLNVLLGNNGAGKTSVLRAVALAALAPVLQVSGFRPVGYVRRHGLERSATVANLELTAVVDESFLVLDAPLQAQIRHLGTQECSKRQTFLRD